MYLASVDFFASPVPFFPSPPPYVLVLPDVVSSHQLPWSVPRMCTQLVVEVQQSAQLWLVAAVVPHLAVTNTTRLTDLIFVTHRVVKQISNQ